MMGFRRRRAPISTLRSTRSEGVTPREDTTKRGASTKTGRQGFLSAGAFLEGFGEDPSVARGQRDPGQRSERRRDVCRRYLLEVFAGRDPEPHEKKRHALVIGIRCAVARYGVEFRVLRRAFRQPVGLLQDVEIATAASEVVQCDGSAGLRKSLAAAR